ncbi:hypothetical protein KY284_035656 [Solanum tuberosum]|nr:hypothetical protein KY284_035656 [Solanum tuberosum]
MEYATESRRTTTESQINDSNSSPQSLFHEERDHYAGNSQENKKISSQCEQFFSLVLAEEVQGGSVMILRDNVIGVVQDNMIGEVDDNNFNDPYYKLEEDDEDYHDVVIERRGMKAKGRPKKNTNGRSNGVGPSTTGILIPQVHQNGESDYDDSDELLEGGTDSDDEFKEVCMNWGIKHMRQLYFTTNDKQRCICKCKHFGCPFHVFASPIRKCDPTIQIKTLNINHRGPTVSDNFHVIPQWIARKYFNNFRADPTWNVSGIIAIVQKDLGYTIEYRKAWRAKQQALKWVYGDEGAQYGKLLRYRADLLNTNPGSNVEIWRDECKFKGFYVCLAPLKEAFKSVCRPLIILDGCWLKGTYGGNLLAAIAIDPNDCIFHSDAESKETWSWFLTNLGYDLEITNSHHIAFMSDRQKGLIGVVKELFPEAEHRNCVRHIYQNFRHKHKGKGLKDLVWNAARASNEVKFKICMERLKQEDREARKWFDHPERPLQTWTRALFKTHSRCDMLLNNLCESFNRVSVEGPGGPFIVDMQKKSCTCSRWDLTGLPCPHALVSIHGNSDKVEDFVNVYYKVETFKNVYLYFINPTNPEDHWPDVMNGGEVLPPKIVKKNIGRKPKLRRKEVAELEKQKKAEAQRQAERRSVKKDEESAPKKLSKKGSIHIKCSICKKDGHNARGHYKYVNIVVPEARQPFETQDLVSDYVSLGYSNQFNHYMWDNSQLDVDLTNQSIITQSAQDEGIDCARGARCALEKSDDYMRGAQCDQEESTDCL